MFSKYPYQDTIIIPRHDRHYKKPFPRPVFSHVFNSYFQISYQSTHLTVLGAPFGRSVIPFRHSVTTSLRFCLHSDNPKIVSIPTNSILPNMVPSNNPVSNPSKSAIHQKTNIPPFCHSIIPYKVLRVRYIVRIQRYRVIQYVTVTNHHVTAINHIYTAINESLIANRLSGYQI